MNNKNHWSYNISAAARRSGTRRSRSTGLNTQCERAIINHHLKRALDTYTLLQGQLIAHCAFIMFGFVAPSSHASFRGQQLNVGVPSKSLMTRRPRATIKVCFVRNQKKFFSFENRSERPSFVPLYWLTLNAC